VVAPFPAGPLLVVSPHLDDAALSCFALLDTDERVTVLDVFTQRPEPEQHTQWDEQSGFAGSHEAHAARRQEEREALGPTGHRVLGADLLDSQYLTGGVDDRDERDADRLAEVLEKWVDRAGDQAAVALPVGAGLPTGARPGLLDRARAKARRRLLFNNSPDHVFVRDVGIETLRNRDEVVIWLYEELPYLWAHRGDRLVPLLADWAQRPVSAVSLPVDRDRKAAMLAAYRSQLPMLFPQPDRLAAVLPGTERYWVLPPAPT
jgi:LmbE family N-acetylglucosaminyl deacetylase